MGPKKVVQKKKEAVGENGGEMNAEEKLKLFMLTCQSLQTQLAERNEEASKAIQEKKEYKKRYDEILNDYNNEKELTLDITKSMTRQYKSMQEELISTINSQKVTIDNLRDQLEQAAVEREQLRKEKDAIIKMRDAEIIELKSKMDSMADEFGSMLRDTLERMRERIEISNSSYDSPDLHIVQKMEEMNLK